MEKATKSVNLHDLEPRVVELIGNMEKDLGYELVITSGYRGLDHPIEKNKKAPGEHTSGEAVDVAVTTTNVFQIVECALNHGIKRIGISRKSGEAHGFVHLGFDNERANPRIWTY